MREINLTRDDERTLHAYDTRVADQARQRDGVLFKNDDTDVKRALRPRDRHSLIRREGRGSKAAGADDVIRYDRVDFAPEMRRHTEGEDIPWYSTAWVGRDSRAACRPCGGECSSSTAHRPGRCLRSTPLCLMAGSFFLTRPSLGHHTAAREELLSRASEVFARGAVGRLDVRDRWATCVALSEVRKAHEDLQGRLTTGKLLLLPRWELRPGLS